MFAVDDNNLSNITVNFVYANDQTIQLENLLQCKKNASIEYSKAIVQNQCVCVWKGIQRRQQIESQLLRGIVYKKNAANYIRCFHWTLWDYSGHSRQECFAFVFAFLVGSE